MLWEVLVKTNFMVFRVEMKSTFPHFQSSPVHPVVAAAVGKVFLSQIKMTRYGTALRMESDFAFFHHLLIATAAAEMTKRKAYELL